MTYRGRVLVVAIVLAVSREARGDDPPQLATPTAHVKEPSTITTDTDPPRSLRLPPGWFVDEPAWAKLDAETRRLQDAETRLTAENKSLRAATTGWQPGWRTIALTLASGIALGYYLDRHL